MLPSPPAEYVLEININPPTEAEDGATIKTKESGKPSGIDSIHSEMLKANTDTSAQILTHLFITFCTKANITVN